MLSVKLELPSKPFKEILQGIRICNEKRRASQPMARRVPDAFSRIRRVRRQAV